MSYCDPGTAHEMASSLWGNARLNVTDPWTGQRNLLGGTKLYGEGVGGKQCLNSCCERAVARPKGTKGQTLVKETVGESSSSFP